MDQNQIQIDLDDAKGYNGVLEENIKIIENENKELKSKQSDIRNKMNGDHNIDKDNSTNNSRERLIFKNQNLHINND